MKNILQPWTSVPSMTGVGHTEGWQLSRYGYESKPKLGYRVGDAGRIGKSLGLRANDDVVNPMYICDGFSWRALQRFHLGD
jgi:hypothetical protein